MKKPPAPPLGSPLEAEPTFFRSLVESSSESTAVIDADARIRYANPAAQRLLGLGTAAGGGRSLIDFIHPQDVERVRRSFDRVANDHAFDATDELRIRRADGAYVWMRSLGRRLLGGPAIGQVLIQLRDITSRREAEARLQEAERQLRRVVDHLPIVIFRIDATGVLTLAEGHGLAALGLAPVDIVGRNVFELFEDGDGLAGVRQALAGRATRSRAEVGGRVWDTQVAPVRDVHGLVTGALGVTLDVTDAARQERAAALQALLLDNVGQAVVAAEPDGRIMYWNQAAERLYGWTAEEAIGRHVSILTAEGVEQEPGTSIIEAVLRGESRTGEYKVRAKSGEVIPVLLTNRPVVEKGEVVGIIGVSSDLRDRKRLEEQLRRAQKMKAVGQLAGGIAHDFNNLLTAIGGYAGMAAERVQDAQVASDIAEVVRATERARKLVDKLLAFGSRSQVVLRPVDLNRALQALMAVMRRALPRGVRLETELAEDVWAVRSDVAQLEQALINLVVNAGEAMPEGGVLTIRTDNVTLGSEAAGRLDASLPAGDYVRLIVQDTGVGMDEAVLSRIFEPFFTTKGLGKGTGLGLSTVFGVLRTLGGAIDVESRPGAGTRFHLYLPRCSEPANGRGFAMPSQAAPPRPGRILLVEDEPAVRRLARRILERDGHTVIEAAHGVEALEQVESGAELDLVVTDVIMPEMGGGELADRLHALRPGIPFLFMSGYTADELKDRGIEATAAFLPKPFPPALLSARVREALDTAPETRVRAHT